MAAPTKEIAVEVVKSGQMLVMEGISIQLCTQGHERKSQGCLQWFWPAPPEGWSCHLLRCGGWGKGRRLICGEDRAQFWT